MPTQTIATGGAIAIMIYCDARVSRLDCTCVLSFEARVLSFVEGKEVLRLILFSQDLPCIIGPRACLGDSRTNLSGHIPYLERLAAQKLRTESI